MFLGQKSFLNCALLYGALSWPAEVSVFVAKTLNFTLTSPTIKMFGLLLVWQEQTADE
jgi:hypothetical protein